MSYLALYRKWRPSDFDMVKGQDAIVRTLRNQIEYQRIGHAYLFCGTRGTGKTSVAKLFAKAVNCQNPDHGSPCNQCPSCRSINSSSSMDVLEIDAASNNGVDNIRSIREQVQYMPVEGKYKIYIIDEVHMLSPGAFNALLKTLEEPPAHVIFILATTEKHKIPVTILSRCQKYDFRRISADTITAHLEDLMEKEGIEAESRALKYIARAADGSMRDALSLLDQCISFYLGQPVTYDHVLDVLGAADNTVFVTLLKCMVSQDAIGVLRVIDDIIAQGRELTQFLADFLWYLRNLLILKDQEDTAGALDLSPEMEESLREDSSLVSTAGLLRYIRILSDLLGQIRASTQKRVLLEVGFIRLCRPETETDTDTLLTRIEHLEAEIARGISYVPSRTEGSSDAREDRPAGAGAEDSPGLSAGENAGTKNRLSGNSGEKRKKTKKKNDLEMLEERFAPSQAEDLKQIAADWRNLVSSLDNPMRRYLKKASVFVEEDSSSLKLVFDPEDLPSTIAVDYFEKDHHANLDQLAAIIARRTGKLVKLFCTNKKPESRSESQGIDLSRIHMDVTIE
ncbi:MAG: DNA polymerase III subunit gamma/tau [Eubacterium sp.]|nr:DNA polymerase III subunit gamma/tau [Eubacterium sp.]